MPYEFFLQKFRQVQCVHLLTENWNDTQMWISLNVPFLDQFQETKFALTLERTSPLVLVLSQVGQESTSIYMT